MLVRYRRINNKGVLERPGTKWKVLRTISITLKCKYSRKVDFLVSCKTKSRENLCLCVRMVRAVTLDTTRPHQFHLKLWKKQFLWKPWFFSFSSVFAPLGCWRWMGEPRSTGVYETCKFHDESTTGRQDTTKACWPGVDTLWTLQVLSRHWQKTKLEKNWKIEFFTKTCFFIIQVEIGAV